MTTQRMHYSTFKIAALAGIAGASLAILFAPRSGRETRDKIRSTTHDMKHRAGEKLESAKHTKDHMEQAMVAGKHSARAKYNELRNQSADDMDTSMPSDLRTNEEEV